jgi:hypothetical protein
VISIQTFGKTWKDLLFQFSAHRFSQTVASLNILAVQSEEQPLEKSKDWPK